MSEFRTYLHDNEFLAVDFDITLIDPDQNDPYWRLLKGSRSTNNSLEALQYSNWTGVPQTVQLWITQYGGPSAWVTCDGQKHEYYGIAYAIHNGDLGDSP